LRVAIGRRLPHVRDVHHPLAVDHRVKQTKNADRTEMLHLFDNAGIAAVDCDQRKGLAVEGAQHALICFAKPNRLCKHCVEHRAEVGGRGIDYAQDLGGRSLLF